MGTKIPPHLQIYAMGSTAFFCLCSRAADNTTCVCWNFLVFFHLMCLV